MTVLIPKNPPTSADFSRASQNLAATDRFLNESEPGDVALPGGGAIPNIQKIIAEMNAEVGTRAPVAIYAIPGEADSTIRILAALTAFGSIICIGSFTVGTPLTYSAGLLAGVPGRTVFQISADLVGTAITLDGEAELTGVKIVGNMPDPAVDSTPWFASIAEAVAKTGIGLQNGVCLKSRKARAYGNEITRVSGWAILSTKNNVGSANRGINTLTRANRLFENYGGLFNPEEAEYMSFAQDSISNNVIGVYNVGGNNSFSTKVHHNYVNFILAAGLNDAHGEMTGGCINHGKWANLIVDKIKNGFLFNSVSMFDGGSIGIYLRKCAGVMISSCSIGRMNIYAEGFDDRVAGEPGLNVIDCNLMSSMGATYKVYRNFNPATGLSDPATPDNLIMSRNRHMWGEFGVNGASSMYLDPAIINDGEGPDPLGWLGKQTDPSVTASRWVSGRPIDGTVFLGAGNQTGAVKITLPVSGFNNSLCTFRISISTTNGNGCLVEFDAYALTGGNWGSARVKRQDGAPYAIRLGRSAAGAPVVYLGEVGTVWAGALVAIENLTMHQGAFALSRNWKRGWSVSREAAAFENVTVTMPAPAIGGRIDYTGDLNDIASDSTVYAQTTAANKPGSGNGMCTTNVRQENSAVRTQFYVSFSGGGAYSRATSTGGGGYSAWQQLHA